MNRSNCAILEDIQRGAERLVPQPGGAAWRNPSSNSTYIHRRLSIVVPVPGTTDELIVAYTCPAGFRAVITQLVFLYIGAVAPVEGDVAQLYYSLRLNSGYFARDFATIDTHLGSLDVPYPIPDGIRLSAGTLIEALVTVPALSPIAVGAPNRVHAHLLGWQWPETE